MGVEMNSTKDLFIGLDLGGTFIKYALGNSDAQLLIKGKKPTGADQPKEAIFAVIFQAIDELISQAEELGGRVAAIGFGSPGAVDFDHGRLMGNTPNIADWGDADIRSTIEGRYGIPLWADNDANVMTLAEARQGAAKGLKHVITLTLGTGIGGGIIIDGKLHRGVNYAGAELGHVTIKYDGEPCNCGGIGCIEQYASAPAMVRHYREKLSKSGKTALHRVTTETIFSQAKKGEAEAMATIDETCEYLGAALASILNIFNPQIIVIGGGVADAGDEFMQQIWNAMERRAMPPSLIDLKLVRAQLGNDAGMVGAIDLAAEMYYANGKAKA